MMQFTCNACGAHAKDNVPTNWLSITIMITPSFNDPENLTAHFCGACAKDTHIERAVEAIMRAAVAVFAR